MSRSLFCRRLSVSFVVLFSLAVLVLITAPRALAGSFIGQVVRSPAAPASAQTVHDSLPCSQQLPGDDSLYTPALQHDSFSAIYRSPGGAVPTNQGTVTLKFRTCANDTVTPPSIRVYDLRAKSEIRSPGSPDAQMTLESTSTDPALGSVALYSYTLPIPTTTNIYYYTFFVRDGSAVSYYRAQLKNVWAGDVSNPGGLGAPEANQGIAYDTSFQLSIYDAAFDVPAWIQRAIIYQIFPDRFRDGNVANDPPVGRFFYGDTTIVRSNTPTWNTRICDPRGIVSPACSGAYSSNFYGGDLQGIRQKIDQGYFDNLGVSALYLNPIFRSPSNHKYDTADYLTIDPDFGSLSDFQALVSSANAHGIKLILDGVFNHVSSDSKYFDRYDRWDGSGNPHSGDDNSGACEGGTSPFLNWFFFGAVSNPGKDGSTVVLCPNGSGDAGQPYEAWYGYSSLPKLQANTTAVRNLIWANGTKSVGPYWVSQGARGWRFDVGADVDQGLDSPANDYWEGFRAAVRAQADDTVTLGEEWGDASKWLLGDEWDSVMNYRFRSAVLGWLFTGCAGGDGCTGGTKFQENDSNDGSSSGSIQYLPPSQFNARLRSIQEDYPPMAFKAMMNLEGSHDTQRVRFLLKKINNDSDAAAVQRMKEWWLFSFTYAGAPTWYYGDEVGLTQDGVPDSDGKYQDDPYNRVPYPWFDGSPDPLSDTPGDNTADASLLGFARKMASIRLSSRVLQDGDVQHGILVDDARRLYGFARTNGTDTALVVLNQDVSNAHNVTLTGLNDPPYSLPDGTVMAEVLNGTVHTVRNGALRNLLVNPAWGIILVRGDRLETPIPPPNLTISANGSSRVLQWSPSATDDSGDRELATSYRVYRGPSSSFRPASGTFLAGVTPPPFGTASGKFTYSDPAAPPEAYYAVCAVNAAGRMACTAPATASAPPALPPAHVLDGSRTAFGPSRATNRTRPAPPGGTTQ